MIAVWMFAKEHYFDAVVENFAWPWVWISFASKIRQLKVKANHSLPFRNAPKCAIFPIQSQLDFSLYKID